MLGFKRLFWSAIVLQIIVYPSECGNVKDWTYSVESIKTTSTNPALFHFDIRTNRIDRGLYGLNGTVTFGENFDDNIMIQIQVFRSQTGSGKYLLTPFQIPQITFYEFMTKYYKKMIMTSIKDCSNFVQFSEAVWDKPIPPNEYYVKNCLLQKDALPDHLQEGYYKLLVSLNSPDIKAMIEIIAKVETQVM